MTIFSLFSKIWSVSAKFIMVICWAVCPQHLQLKAPSFKVSALMGYNSKELQCQGAAEVSSRHLPLEVSIPKC